jgi:uncharacterized iron-regulated membrane protein
MCAGLLAAVFLFLLGVSGSLLAFESEINQALNPKLSWVRPAPQRLSLAEIELRLGNAYPGYEVIGIAIPPQPDMAWTTFMANEALRKQIGLAFNPYTAEVLGNLADGNHFMDKVRQLHVRLLAGQTGRTIVSWAAILLCFLSLSGMVLWWPRKILWVNWRRPFKLVNWDLHQALGIYLSVFLFVFSLTAIIIHWDAEAMKLIGRVTGVPETPNFPEPQQAPAGAVPLSPDRLLATAEGSTPGTHAMGMLFVGNLVRVWLGYPGDRTPGETGVFVDQYTGKVVYQMNPNTMPLGFRIIKAWNRQLHTGDIGGLPTRILACLVSLLLPFLTVTGPLIWLLRVAPSTRSRGRGTSDSVS